MAEHNRGHIYTVADLTREIKNLLEDRFPFIWITGEISNYAVPGSGHSYFSLKDGQSVINCVMFKGQKRNLKFEPENGLKVLGLGRLSLYEPRGAYQLIFEHLEPDGIGSLQKAFEQLKQKLADQGLFDTAHKQPLPFLPRKISIVTSPTGAAIRDIIHISLRRFPKCRLQVVPVKVQGHGAENEVVHAIETVNARSEADLIILARGGGSIEDLAAFNTEIVARAIFQSKIPIITGIGHETDFTIADFTADLRAPTPSGAAEQALPEYAELSDRLKAQQDRLKAAMSRKTEFCHQRLDDLHARLRSPALVIRDYRQRLEDNLKRMQNTLGRQMEMKTQTLSWACDRLAGAAPDTDSRRSQVDHWIQAMTQAFETTLDRGRNRVRENIAALSALSPVSVLERGYSITRTLPGQKVVMDAGAVETEARLEIILSKGRLETRVEKIVHGKENV